MKNVLSIGAASAFTLAIAAPGHAGTVTLGNGDVIEGEVVSSTDTGVELIHKDLGTLNIPADNVAGMKLSNSDPAYTGGGGGWFFPGWDKSIKAGFSGASGNSDNLNFYASFATDYEDEQDRWIIDANYFYSESDGEETQNELTARVIKDWLIPGEAYFYWASLQYQRDEFTIWEERVSGYVGAGYEFINRPDDFELVGRLGAGANYESGQVGDTTPELFAGLEANWTIDDQSSLKGFAYLYPSLDPAFSDWRGQSGLTYKLAIASARGMSLELGVRNDYNSKTEDPFDANDVKYFGALVYDF